MLLWRPSTPLSCGSTGPYLMDPFVLNPVPVQIAQGSALSAEVDIGGGTLVGISIPAAWVTASLSFQASQDGGATWGELLDQTATAVSVASIAGGAETQIAFDPTKLRGVRSVKVRSGTSGTPVNQTAAGGVTLTLLARFIF